VNFFQWLEHTSVITTISNSKWMYPAVEVTHFFSLFLLVGTAAVIDLRLLGLAGRRQSASELAEQLFPWSWIGLVLCVLSGFIMFAASATGFVANAQFLIKMVVTVVAIAFGVIVQRSTPKWDQPTGTPLLAKVTAAISLALWIGAILMAAEIANYSEL
jgi:small-conductance mechanosensitive channel